MMQLVAYAAFALTIGYFSFWPRYDYASPDLASVKVSLSHAADRIEPCIRLTPAEIAELAPNMRTAERCSRARLPIVLELEVDGKVLLSVTAPPSGLWGDGPASIYERFGFAPGTHRFTARLRDTARSDGWDYEFSDEVVLRPGRYLIVTFHGGDGGFRFR